MTWWGKWASSLVESYCPYKRTGNNTKTGNCFSLDRAHATFLEIWPADVQKFKNICGIVEKNKQRNKPICRNFPFPSLSKIMEIGRQKDLLWYYITSVFHFTSIAVMICLCKSALNKKKNINVEEQEYFLQFSCQKHDGAKFFSFFFLIFFF